MPLLRLVPNFKNYFTPRVASRYLFLRLHRFRQRERLRHDHFDFFVVGPDLIMPSTGFTPAAMTRMSN